MCVRLSLQQYGRAWTALHHKDIKKNSKCARMRKLKGKGLNGADDR